ncbi:hypothetical protein L6164_027136 [Bauhinia variegata]|uniref:Uncharacterized protein n=1 Tax=Bauhinia variegata TaxID=167791 RepID=A0ACB9LSG0_BAUVA|nr:hypothetical protein L6164_027136 [Bauhinia variegata]
MMQLHLPSSSSPFTAQYCIKVCPNNCLSSKFLPLSSASKPSSSSFSLTLPTFSTRRLVIKCRQSEFFDQNSFSSRADSEDSSFYPRYSSAPSDGRGREEVGALPPRVFVGHSIYKGKAALTVTPRPPGFAPLDSGAFKVSREGYVLLQFAPAVGMRQYDWNRKQVFSLSVSEMGSIISLGARGSCEFFHDPFKGKSDEGQVRKVLKVEPLPDDSGHFFNLSVQNKLVNVDESIYIPVTKSELAVFNSIFNFIMPYLLGWHAFANTIEPKDLGRTNNANPRYGADYEWSRY